MMRKKLLIVVSGAKFFLSHRLALAQAAAASGYEVHVATPASSLSHSITAAGLMYHCISLDRGGFNPCRDVMAFFSLYRLYQKIKPDIVHQVTLKPILYGGLAARLAQVPSVVNAFTGLGYLFISDRFLMQGLRKLVELGYKIGFRHPNLRVIFQNNEDRWQFVDKKLLHERNTVLIRGSGVDMKAFSFSEESNDTPVVILPARMLWDKGVAEFVAAARMIQHRGFAVRFALIGEGDAANPAVVPTQQLHDWVREGVVEWWGERHDMPAVMRQSHIVCLPSYREGLPRVLVEAAASGRAIITTETPGCREVVSHGKNGLLVPIKNVTALVEAIITLLNNPELRKTMGRLGRQRVERDYDLAVILQQTLAIYENLDQPTFNALV